MRCSYCSCCWCSCLLILLLAVPPPPPARWKLITRTHQDLQSLFTSTLARVPADRCQQEPWTEQEAENKCATICILTGCGPRRPRVLYARATDDFQTAICRPSTSPGPVPWDVTMVTPRDFQVVCGRSVPPTVPYTCL